MRKKDNIFSLSQKHFYDLKKLNYWGFFFFFTHLVLNITKLKQAIKPNIRKFKLTRNSTNNVIKSKELRIKKDKIKSFWRDLKSQTLRKIWKNKKKVKRNFENGFIRWNSFYVFSIIIFEYQELYCIFWKKEKSSQNFHWIKRSFLNVNVGWVR